MSDSKKHTVPEKVLFHLKEMGANHAEYIATTDAGEIYSAEYLDSDGIPVPTGLPAFVIYKDDEISSVCGEKGLALHDSLFGDK